ncbi:DUF58 domain-containing protein [archaeon]|jgi:uncharacterized protein (DUF58 family)|nr:DUF58 domain-containing protein [archaeon]MBT4241695.1 DUF58 domain-containing protein [archaeon]MBT4418243.1 DUF58 domain-containing protein [archaeon]
MTQKLNTDIAESVSELEMLMRRLLPRELEYKFIRGRGLEFDGYRDFSPEDDAVNIDWKASVRAQKTLVRKYIEEKDKKFMFFVDCSENMVFGSTEKLKCEYTAEMSAALSHLILNSGDRVGFVLFNDNVIRFQKPKLGNRQFEIFVYELTHAKNYGGFSNLDKVIDLTIGDMDRETSLIFLVSDFIKFDETYKKNLELLSGLFEVVALIIRDPLDKSFPNVDREVIIESPETGEKMLINPSLAKNVYEKRSVEQLNFVKESFRNLNIDFLELETDKPFSEAVAGFFKERLNWGAK